MRPWMRVQFVARLSDRTGISAGTGGTQVDPHAYQLTNA